MSETSQKDAERKFALIDSHIHALQEHFDTVHIFVTKYDPADGTNMVNRGSGHWCARYGQIKEFIVYEEERMREEARPHTFP